MKTTDMTETLERALKASGCDQANVVHKLRLLSDNGASYISGELADWLEDNGIQHTRGAPCHPQTQGKIERLASDPQKPCPAGELLPTRRFGGADQGLHQLLQSPPLPRKPEKPHPCRCLFCPKGSTSTGPITSCRGYGKSSKSSNSYVRPLSYTNSEISGTRPAFSAAS